MGRGRAVGSKSPGPLSVCRTWGYVGMLATWLPIHFALAENGAEFPCCKGRDGCKGWTKRYAYSAGDGLAKVPPSLTQGGSPLKTPRRPPPPTAPLHHATPQ